MSMWYFLTRTGPGRFSVVGGMLAIVLCACAEDQTNQVKIPKTHYVVTGNPLVSISGQSGVWLTDVRDAETGAEYLIVQSGSGGVSIIQKPTKPAPTPEAAK